MGRKRLPVPDISPDEIKAKLSGLRRALRLARRKNPDKLDPEARMLPARIGQLRAMIRRHANARKVAVREAKANPRRS